MQCISHALLFFSSTTKKEFIVWKQKIQDDGQADGRGQIYIKSGLYNRKEAEKRDMSSLIVATLPISEHHLQP